MHVLELFPGNTQDIEPARDAPQARSAKFTKTRKNGNQAKSAKCVAICFSCGCGGGRKGWGKRGSPSQRKAVLGPRQKMATTPQRTSGRTNPQVSKRYPLHYGTCRRNVKEATASELQASSHPTNNREHRQPQTNKRQRQRTRRATKKTP